MWWVGDFGDLGMKEGTIRLQAVREEITRYVGEDGQSKSFSLTFVKIQGAEKGKLRTFARARRGGKDIEKGETHGTKNKEFYRMKERNLILIHDLDSKGDRSVNVHLITHFNGLRVVH
jgi:hypothetical protein